MITELQIKEVEEKRHRAISFGIEHMMKEFYKREVNVDKELKSQTYRYQTKYSSYNSFLHLTLSTTMSYLFTPDETLKKEICENIGKDLSNQGLDELDKLFENAINESMEKGYNKKMFEMMKQDLFTFDFGISDLYGTIKYCIDYLVIGNMKKLIEIKTKFHEYSIMCPKCYKCLIPESETFCSVCKEKKD